MKRLAPLLALVVAAAWAAAQGTAASADSTCTYSARTATVAAASAKPARLRVGDGGAILLDGSPCGGATTGNTDAVEAAGSGAELEVDLRGGSFERVPIDVRLTGGNTLVRVVGSRAGDEIAAKGATVRLPASEGDRIDLRGVALLAVDGGEGADTIDARRYDGKASLSGGAGPDALTGGPEGDVLRGGSGRDRLRGGGGSDRLFGGKGRDSASGGAGRDRIAGGAGRDTCTGGADRDWLGSCGSPFLFEASKIDAQTRERITGSSWHPGCPVGIESLRLIHLRFWGFDSDVHRGKLIVHRDAVSAIRSAMRTMFRNHFRIRRMRLIDDYGADDHRSMDADNTSAFNCREVAGKPGVWSRHAYGRAIDINTIENPYVTPSGYVSPPAGRAYADRSRHAPGMIHSGDATTRAFAAAGWGWAGDWSGTKDYQHFSSTGD